jgi:DNA-directed RNA polymerase alpha subunit
VPDQDDVSEIQSDAFDAGRKSGYRQAARDMEQFTGGMVGAQSADQLNASVDDLNLTSRTYLALKRSGIHDVTALLPYSADTLRNLPHASDDIVAEVDNAFAAIGLRRLNQ